MMAYRGFLIIIVGAVVHHFSDCHAHFDRSKRASGPEFIIFETVTVKPELEFTQGKIHYLEFNIPHLVFRCQFNDRNLLFYTVNWYVDEKPFLGTMGPSRNIDDLVLREDHLLSNNISLGIYVRCGVRASMTANGTRTPLKVSANMYAGIKVQESNIYLDKGSSTVVQFKPTVPIGCRYLSRLSMTGCRADIKMFINDDSPLQCESESILIKSFNSHGCGLFIQTMTKGDTWDPAIKYNFTIVTSDMNYDDKDTFILKLQFGKALGHAIWRGYLFPDITVFVQNMEKYKSKICKSRGDPHMTTADGYRYENHIEGIYMMYINTKYNIEVQQIIKQCNNGLPYAKCTCGVAISAGQDVFMINRCGSINYLGFTQCGDGGILDVQRINQYHYKVFTPIGTRISIIITTGSKCMNIDITMAPKDIGNVYGLCGRFDGDKSNDLSHRNSDVVTPIGTRIYNYHLEFYESWRIDEIAEENLFRPSPRALTPWIQQNGLYCVCDSDVRVKKALCSPTQYLNCTKQNSITKQKCFSSHREKRHVRNNSSKEVQRLLSKIAVHFNNRRKREHIPEIVISEKSRATCKNKISGIPALTYFKDMGSTDDEKIILQQCEFDLSVFNGSSSEDFNIDVLNDAVKDMLDLRPKIAKNDMGKIETFYLNTCPRNCSNNGQCDKPGICSCHTFYKGSDCSIDERDGLTIQDIEGGGECDLADGEECECFYVRSENIQENFTCSVNTSKILINGNVEFISSDSLPGVYEDIFTGICCAPRRITGESDVFVALYTIAISNNGLNFGNTKNMYVFNSTCQKVSSNENKSFELKDEYCFIDGICFSEDEMAPVGCRSCQSSIAPYSWTDKNPCLNGGYCSDKTTGYICNCKTGFLGTNCEFEINECQSNPCKNGGTCNNLENGFECSCVPGYEGVVCETVSNAIIGDDENTCAIYIKLHGQCEDGRRCMVKEGRPTCVSGPEHDSNVLSHVTLVAICSLFVSVIVATSIFICLRGKYRRIIDKTSDGKQRLESNTERIDSPKAYLL